MTAAAPRLSHLTGMTLSRPRPPIMASPAATHSAVTAPTATDSGSWYLTARFAVTIWVRSPNSAAKTTAKLVRATGRNARRDSRSTTYSSLWAGFWRSRSTAPTTNSTATAICIGWCGSRLSRPPTVTASAT